MPYYIYDLYLYLYLYLMHLRGDEKNRVKRITVRCKSLLFLECAYYNPLRAYHTVIHDARREVFSMNIKQRVCFGFLAVLAVLAMPWSSALATVPIAAGLGQGGGGYVEKFSETFENQGWPRLNWNTYNSSSGETRPVYCDVDGDNKFELVVGLGAMGTGYLAVLDDADQNHAHLAWISIPWRTYNEANGETIPACGDLDGDGKDEIVVGLGHGGNGWVVLFDDADTQYAVLKWTRVGWSGYNSGGGAVHPAVGNLDGDSNEEVVLGLGEGGGGWVEVLDDATAGYASLAWVQLGWEGYQTAHGAVWPAACDLNGDGQDDILFGLGQGGEGWLRAFDSARGFSPMTHNNGWMRLGWAEYNTEIGATFPACGDLDGDGFNEIVLGLQSGSFGYLQVLDDFNTDFTSLGWARLNWGAYNTTNGLSRPTVGRVAAAVDAGVVSSDTLRFHLADAVVLQAMDDVIDDNPATRKRPRTLSGPSGATRTNLLAVGPGGSTVPAIETPLDEQGSPLDADVMFTLADAAQEHVYIALDPISSAALIAQQGCALFRVSTADDSYTCIHEGVYLGNMHEEFRQRTGGKLKPLQLDNAGRLYYAASPFTVQGNGIGMGTWQPIVYRYSPRNAETTAITHDALDVRFFMVLGTGEVVYQGANQTTNQDQLWMFRTGASIDLTQTPPSFFMRDTYRTLLWVGENAQQVPGFWFARGRNGASGAVDRVFLPTEQQAGVAMAPNQVVVGDDGGLYAVFASQTDGVRFNQVLPRIAEATKAQFNYPVGGMLNRAPTYITKGYLYYLDRYDPSAGYGTRDVIRQVRLLDGRQETLLDDRHYEIFAWRVRGNMLYFSGRDKSRSSSILGQIDTMAVRRGEASSDYLTLDTITGIGTLAAGNRVKDMEIMEPVEPEQDPGYSPIGTLKLLDDATEQASAYALSIEFSKYMNRESVESGLSLVPSDSAGAPSNGAQIEWMNMWLFKTLHMIPDLDDTGMGDAQQTTPLNSAARYDIAIAQAQDAYAWELLQGNSFSVTAESLPEPSSVPVTQPDPVADTVANAIGTVTGRVTDARSSEPIAGATVSIDRSGGDRIQTQTDASGRYAIQVPAFDGHFVLAVSKSAYLPRAEGLDASLVTTSVDFVRDVSLQPVAHNNALALEEDQGVVHHLGDSNFGGSINSQFQKEAEGVQLTVEFDIAGLSVASGTPTLHYLAKGVQTGSLHYANEIRLNGVLQGHMQDSPRDGSYSAEQLVLHVGDLSPGVNTLTITSGYQFGDNDDFEFTNLLLRW